MKKLLKNKKIYLIYTILFILIALCVFFLFVKNKYSFIWQEDGLKQHFIILKDFNENVKNFFANPKEGLKLFSWNMGLGLDVIGQYSYYVLGDPFSYISLLFPIQNLESTYTFLILLRMFCIGLAFIFYAKYHIKVKNNNINEKQESLQVKKLKENRINFKILIGAIIYTFSSFSLFAGVRHPYFLNAMILFPMLLLGVDKLLKENKKVFLTIFVAISAISNYYFFYMHTVMIVIYAIIVYLCEYKKEGIQHFFKKLGSACICYIIGVLIATVILFPTIYAFLNSARSGEETICQYGIDYYKSLFSINLLTAYGENWSYIGVSSIILLMIPILWNRRKENKIYLIYLIVTTIMLLVPFLGSVMNGFSFPNNRWSFAYSFILAYIVTLCIRKKYTKKELKNMCIFLIIYSLAAIISVLSIKPVTARYVVYFIQIIIAYLGLAVILYQNLKRSLSNKNEVNTNKHYTNKLAMLRIKLVENIRKKQKLPFFHIAIFVLVVSSISLTAYGLYSAYDRNYVKEFVKMKSSEKQISTQLGKNKSYEQNIKNILQNDTSFYRISKFSHQVQNFSIYYKYPSTECFLSIGNKYVYDLNKELADNNYSTTSSIRGVGDRTKITTMLANKYYVVDEKNESNVPYGYTLIEENENAKTYKNNFSLEVGVAYEEYLLKEEYEKLNPLQKEDALLKVAVIENEEDLNAKSLKRKENLEDIQNSSYQIPYKITDASNIIKQKYETETTVNEIKGEIVTKKANQKIEIEIPEIKNSEIYVYMSGFEYKQTNKHVITASFNQKNVSKNIENKITSAYFQKSPELLLPLGYYEKAQGTISLNFSAIGNYEFESLQIIAVPMDSYEQTIKQLKQNELKNVECSNNKIKGNIQIKNDCILQISTSYTTGWKAYVDGVETSTINVNTAFIGIPLSKGKHEIELKYEVPYLKIGIACSTAGIVLFIILVVVEKRKNRK